MVAQARRDPAGGKGGDSTSSQLTVAVRIRPLMNNEKARGRVAEALDDKMVTLMDNDGDKNDVLRQKRRQEKQFVYDIAFGEDSSQVSRVWLLSGSKMFNIFPCFIILTYVCMIQALCCKYVHATYSSERRFSLTVVIVFSHSQGRVQVSAYKPSRFVDHYVCSSLLCPFCGLRGPPRPPGRYTVAARTDRRATCSELRHGPPPRPHRPQTRQH
ncbi:Kinesin-like protein KIF19 [Amphibalanus amphitrite]|uniref:Kinesin-like protein KIF19 n=1 Tax=Amphibalanus amphitrite TaxID=1232801 RepID=A0A6A4WM51_AMPAM|nr:Kinesin-like protein KIF19 [Amphibalanus amphitrite]